MLSHQCFLPRLITSFSTYRLIVVALCLSVTVIQTKAQRTPAPSANARGVPNGSYAMSDIDSVNLFNGRVNIHIPLFDISGRGTVMGQARVTWDAPAQWHVNESRDANGNPYYTALSETDAASYYSRGLNLGVPSVFFSESTDGATNLCADGIRQTWQLTLVRATLVDGNGTEHSMKDVLTDGQALTNNGSCSGSGGPSRGRVFVTTDGTSITYVADAEVRDGIIVGIEQAQGGGSGGWLYYPNGSRYRFENGVVREIDRNGNQTVFGSSVTDPLQRQVTMSSSLSGAQCAAQGLSGNGSCFNVSSM